MDSTLPGRPARSLLGAVVAVALLGLPGCASSRPAGDGTFVPGAPPATGDQDTATGREPVVIPSDGPAAAAGPAVPEKGGFVKPGDTLDISVFGHPELSRVASVQPDGAVSFPFLGRVVVKGRTVEDIGREIAQSLEKDYSLRDPRVSVAVSSFGERTAFVLGRVLQSGSHQISLNRPMTLLQLISLAGGFSSDADRSRVLVQRTREDGARVVFSVDLTGVEREGDMRNDRPLQDGDTIFVPRADEVSVLGQVNKPGSFVMQADRPLTLLRAIAAAEGFTRLAKPSAITWMRKSASGVRTATVDGDAILAGSAPDPVVEPGDILFVPREGLVSEPVDPTVGPNRAEEAEGSGIRDFLSMLSRHKWASLVVFAVAVAVGALNSFRAERVYTSTPALLELTATGTGVARVSDVFEREMLTAQTFETLVIVLKSESILRAAYEDTPAAREKMEYPSFADAVRVEPVRNCYLVRITFESAWPELNPVAANAVARAFIQVTRQQRETHTSRAGLELETRRDGLRRKLEAAEQVLDEFHKTHAKADVLAEKSKVDTQLALLEAQFDQKQLDLLAKEKARGEVEAARKAGNLSQVAEVFSDKTYQDMESEIRRKEAERFTTLKTYTAGSDQVKAVDEELQYLRKRRDRFVDAIVGKIETAFEGARAEVAKIGELRDARLAVQKDLARLVVEQTSLEADRDRIRRDLDALVAQASEVVGTAGFDFNPGVLHEEARPFYVPIRPRHTRDVIMAIFMASLLGVGVSYLLEQFNDAATRPEDVTRVTGLPVLGMLPRRAASSDRPDLAALEDPHGEVSEAVRIIRTCILYTPSGKSERRKILVTSAEPGEGKTLFATNLAVALAQAGQNTLLVDGDLRRPRLHKVFGLDNDRGLTHIFTNGSIKPPTHRVGESGGSPFDVVFSGPIPPNPAELVGGKRMSEFLEASTREYDRIVIDCPPAGPVSDPALLARQVDGVILVVHLGKTSLRSLRRACDHLQKVAAPLLGVVLNGVTMGGGYHYYYSQYGSSVGEGAKKTRGG